MAHSPEMPPQKIEPTGEITEVPADTAPDDGVGDVTDLRRILAETKGDGAARRTRIAEFRDGLVRRHEGIGQAVTALWSAVAAHPDATREELLAIVQEKAEGYGFERELYRFDQPIDEYLAKHAAVEKYRALYPVDDDLYAACFGTRPTGKVEVVTGPMTLTFQCLDTKDYRVIHSYQYHRGDGKRIPAATNRRLTPSAGVAIAMPDSDLAGTVSAVMVPMQTELSWATETEQTERLHGTATGFYLDNLGGNVSIEVDDGTGWIL